MDLVGAFFPEAPTLRVPDQRAVNRGPRTARQGPNGLENELFIEAGTDKYFTLQNSSEANEELNLAVVDLPELVDTWGLRGVCRLCLERHEEAIEDFDEALRLDACCDFVVPYRAMACEALGRWSEASRDYRRAVEWWSTKDAAVCRAARFLAKALGRRA